MNKEIVPEYTIPTNSYLKSAIITLPMSIIAIVTNAYFFKKSINHKSFIKRPMFRFMIMTFSIVYIIGCFIHIAFTIYYLIYYYLQEPIHVNTCSKLRIIDINWNEFIIVTPFYFNITRFYKIIFKKTIDLFLLTLIMIISMGPLFYLMFGQLMEIGVYYVQKVGCSYDLYSNIPFFENLLFINLYILVIIPIISLILNFSILLIVINKQKNISNKFIIIEQKILFQTVGIQSLLPFLCQLPILLLTLYQTKCKFFF